MQLCIICGSSCGTDSDGQRAKDLVPVTSSENTLDDWFCSECRFEESNDESPLRIRWTL